METLLKGPESEPHLDEEQAEQYALGCMPEGEAAVWEEHLLVCEPCRGRVSQADEWLRAVQSAALKIRREPRRKPAWRPRLFPVFAAAAIAALAAALCVAPGGVNARQAAGITLMAVRGPAGEAHAPTRTPLALQPDLTGVEAAPPLGIEIVDRHGMRLWRNVFPGPAAPPLGAGVYFVRVYSGEGRLCREYPLLVGQPE